MMAFKIISFINMIGFMFLFLRLVYFILAYDVHIDFKVYVIGSLTACALGFVTQYYSCMNPSNDWWLKAFALIVWVKVHPLCNYISKTFPKYSNKP